MKLKFTEEDWDRLVEATEPLKPAANAHDFCIALYRMTAERVGYNPRFMLSLGRKYNPRAFVVTSSFEKRLLELISKETGKVVHPFSWVNCSPSTYNAEEYQLQDDEILVDTEKCFQ